MFSAARPWHQGGLKQPSAGRQRYGLFSKSIYMRYPWKITPVWGSLCCSKNGKLLQSTGNHSLHQHWCRVLTSLAWLLQTLCIGIDCRDYLVKTLLYVGAVTFTFLFHIFSNLYFMRWKIPLGARRSRNDFLWMLTVVWSTLHDQFYSAAMAQT